MVTAFVKTPLGMAKIEGDSKGVTSICVLDDIEETSSENPQELTEAVRQLQEYFNGNLKNFTFDLNPKGTEFQKKVWGALLKIPFGKTISYLDLSKKLGDPKAIRAVAAANGKNPIWIVIPCHRVVGSKGEMVGYAGGIHRKKWLLNHERSEKQQSLFP
ncbi:methylated-DNA--[protein]-cysteine S-methyltransferase [Muriicola marianensis]|uniref:Methylated-DNA--protein-cysteine methyltransferase n=1 Tax=Muriicola marianensis TaxID=1324801 RepID=A0ABQ1QW29_9FLAO|nr:methylated-DNA--[protein]-cysteine S-methyltransferase [Muriicola marianensis]GGD49043.1 methylated-DNA--protein-cysteine methyltransferase [Muriicola marianensis]